MALFFSNGLYNAHFVHCCQAVNPDPCSTVSGIAHFFAWIAGNLMYPSSKRGALYMRLPKLSILITSRLTRVSDFSMASAYHSIRFALHDPYLIMYTPLRLRANSCTIFCSDAITIASLTILLLIVNCSCLILAPNVSAAFLGL